MSKSAPELFGPMHLLRTPLSDTDKKSLVDTLILSARLGQKYFYTLKETAGLLRISYDELQTLVDFYRLDAVRVLSLVRIPWWSLCEYLIDPADDLDTNFYAYLNSIVPKTIDKTEVQNERI